MNFKSITSENKSDFEFIKDLYMESFPPEERRSVIEFQQLMDEDESFTVDLVLDDNERTIGFLTHWLLGDFVYAEHFAISPALRNGGSGRKVLDAFLAKIKYPLVLEVELPNNEISQRRINFYERAGLKVWDINYIQPSYGPGLDSIQMLLMTYGNIDLKSKFDAVKDSLYKRVYKTF